MPVSAVLNLPSSINELPLEEWNQTFSETDHEYYANSVKQTEDGGYVLAGSAYSFINYTYPEKVLIIKTDVDGNQMWKKTFGEINSYSSAVSVEQTLDGGYVLGGSTFSSMDWTQKAWLIKTDADGIQVWKKTFGGTDVNSRVASVQLTADGGFIIAGSTYSTVDWINRVWLVKTDANGNLSWMKTFYEIPGYSSAYSVKQTAEGGYIISGGTQGKALIIKTDTYGDLLWNKTFEVTDDDSFSTSVQQTADGGYVLAGNSFSYMDWTLKAWLIKTDADGIQHWIKIFEKTDCDYWEASVLQDKDGGFMLADSITSKLDYTSKAWLIKTDVNGNHLWNNTYGENNSYPRVTSIQKTTDGGYILSGFTYSNTDINVKALLIKVSSDTASETYTVCPSGCDNTSIQAAVDAANTGDIIEVHSGTYYENVDVNKQLTLLGVDTGSDQPVVDGKGKGKGSVMTLSANGIVLNGFTIINKGNMKEDAGIKIISNNNEISGNVVNGNDQGMYLLNAYGNIFTNNYVFDNEIGIMLGNSTNNDIINNFINNCEKSIYLKNSEFNLINNNSCFNNEINIKLDNSASNSIINNNVSNSEIGIRLVASIENIINQNSASDNEIGIDLRNSDYNSIISNNISGNELGIKVKSSLDNIVYHNNFVNNAKSGKVDSLNNLWDSGYPSGGNYWSDYTGLDQYSGPVQNLMGSDGIGDTPYFISKGISAQDRYPLMEPWIETEEDHTPPNITVTSPENLETNVSIDTTIQATFNEFIQSSTLNNSTVKVHNLDRIEGETFGNSTAEWNSSNFGGFIHNEELVVQQVGQSWVILEDYLTYSTHYVTKDYPVYTAEGIEVYGSGNYGAIGWLGEEYVVVDTGSSEWRLTNVIFEQNITDTKTLQIGESWDLGDGYSIRLREIDVGLTKAWMGLNNSSGEIRNLVVNNQSPFIVTADLGAADDTPILVTYLSKVNNTSIQLKYTWFISLDVKVIYAGTDLIHDFDVSISSYWITVGNDEDIGLPMGGTVPLFGDFLFETDDGPMFKYRLIREIEGTPLQGDISYDSTSKTVTFDPVSDLLYDTTYVSTITTGVEDLAGNRLAEDYLWEFRTME